MAALTVVDWLLAGAMIGGSLRIFWAWAYHRGWKAGFKKCGQIDDEARERADMQRYELWKRTL